MGSLGLPPAAEAKLGAGAASTSPAQAVALPGLVRLPTPAPAGMAAHLTQLRASKHPQDASWTFPRFSLTLWQG